MLSLFWGQESFLAKEKIARLQKEAREQGAFLGVIDCAEKGEEEAFRELGAPSLFLQKKFLLFENPFAAKDFGAGKEFQQLLLRSKDHTLLFFHEGAPPKSNPLFAFLRKHASTEEFPKLSRTQLKRWIHHEVARQGALAAPGAEDFLMMSAPGDTRSLSQEIQKLVSYTYFSRTRGITKEDIALLVCRQADPRIFSTIDAIAQKNRKEATRLLAEHFKAGENPLYLLSMLAWQFRLLLSVKEYQEKGATREKIASELKAHPFLIQKSLASCKQFSLEELKKLYDRIISLDLSFKTSKGDPSQLLYLFVGQAAA